MEGNVEVVDEVKGRLLNLAEDMLIVLDNCDEAGKDYGEYVPVCERMSGVITSRSPECEAHATYNRKKNRDVE